MLYLTRDRTPECTTRPYDNGLDRLFDEMTRGFGLVPPTAFAASEFEPVLDVAESRDQWIVRTELPGVAPEDVEISVTGNVLTLKGEKKSEKSADGEAFRRTERRHGKFLRSLEFPTELDAAKVEATAKHGVLTIVLPKAEAAKPRAISIKAE
jgi:HSP20 family protein